MVYRVHKKHKTTLFGMKVIIGLGFGGAVKKHHLEVPHKEEEVCHYRIGLEERPEDGRRAGIPGSIASARHQKQTHFPNFSDMNTGKEKSWAV
jgi:hypothetical protein